MANASESKPLLTSLPNDDNEENEDNEEAVEVWIIGWNVGIAKYLSMTSGLFFRLYVSQRLNSPSLLTDGYSLLHLYG